MTASALLCNVDNMLHSLCVTLESPVACATLRCLWIVCVFLDQRYENNKWKWGTTGYVLIWGRKRVFFFQTIVWTGLLVMHIVVWRGFVLSLFLLFFLTSDRLFIFIFIYFFFFWQGQASADGRNMFPTIQTSTDFLSFVFYWTTSPLYLQVQYGSQQWLGPRGWTSFFFFLFGRSSEICSQTGVGRLSEFFFPSGQNSADYLKYRSKTRLSDFR